MKSHSSYPIPSTIPNYKTIKCKYWEKGHCRYQGSCSFAHGDQDLRAQNGPGRQNVTNMQMNTNMMSYMSESSTVQNQIVQQQILSLISQMEKYHSNDKEIISKLMQASELNQAGNVQDAASMVFNIINRQNKTKEDSDQYAIFMQSIQNFGSMMYQQLQMHHAQQSFSGMYGFNPQALMSAQMMGNMNMPINNTNSNMTQYNTHQFKETAPGKNLPQSNPSENEENKNINDGSENKNIDSTNMEGITNMVGNMQISPNYNNYYQKQYNNKPKYNKRHHYDQS
jgi:hypothetical protein